MPKLFKSDYAAIEHRVASRLVRVVRSSKQFDGTPDANAEVARWAACLEGLDSSQLGILMDWRLAPLSTDPEVLREIVAGTNVIAQHFARHVVLVVSSLGVMQAERLQRIHESGAQIVTDEDEALRYLMER